MWQKCRAYHFFMYINIFTSIIYLLLVQLNTSLINTGGSITPSTHPLATGTVQLSYCSAKKSIPGGSSVRRTDDMQWGLDESCNCSDLQWVRSVGGRPRVLQPVQGMPEWALAPGQPGDWPGGHNLLQGWLGEGGGNKAPIRVNILVKPRVKQKAHQGLLVKTAYQND